MKRTICGLISVLFLLSVWASAYSIPKIAKATDPSYPDQGCVNGVQNSGLYVMTDYSPTVVFKPRFNWLNGVSVRIKALSSPATPRIKVAIWDWHSNPHREIASHTVEITDRVNENWQFVTQSSQDMDPGLEYAIVLTPRDGTRAYWSGTTNASCYPPGYALSNGNPSEIMFGFATYGWYDPSNPNTDGTSPGDGSADSGSSSTPDSGGSINTDPSGAAGSSSSTGSSSDSSGSNSGSNSSTTGSNSTGSSGSDYPSIEEILGMAGHGDQDSWFGRLFSSPIMFYLWPILSFLFWVGLILLIIILIVRHNRKKKKLAETAKESSPSPDAKTAADPAPKADEKPTKK